MPYAVPMVLVRQAILFVPALDTPGDALLSALEETLKRVAIHAERLRLVDLRNQPALGRKYRVRVVPCLVLDTGTRQVQLPGDLARLDSGRIEQSLSSL